MTKEQIRSAMQRAGTYDESFEPMIELLEQTQEDLELARQAWKDPDKGNGLFVLSKPTATGGVTEIKSPYYLSVITLREQCTKLFVQLGLTPVGLKRTAAGSRPPKQDSGSKLETLLSVAAQAAGV